MTDSCICTNRENPPAIQLLSSLQMVTFSTLSLLFWERLRKERYLKMRGIDSPGCRKKVLFSPIMS